MGLNHVRAMADISQAQLAAVVDVDRARADDTAKQFNCAAFYETRDVLGKADAVIVATPPETHAAVSAPFLEAGIPCLIEKPLAMTPADCAVIMDAAAKKNTCVAVGHVERFNPAVETLLAEKISASEIQTITARRMAPAGGRIVPVDIVSDMMIHDLDIVLALMGNNVTAVSGYGDPQNRSQAEVKFAGGGTAKLIADRKAPERVRDLTLTTAKYEYRLDFMARTVIKTDRTTQHTENLTVTPHDALRAEIGNFITAAQTGVAARVTPSQALSAMRVAWEILDRMRGCQA